MGLAMSCSELEDMLSERGMLETSIRERDAGNIHQRGEFWKYFQWEGCLEQGVREGPWENYLGDREAGNTPWRKGSWEHLSKKRMLGTSCQRGICGKATRGPLLHPGSHVWPQIPSGPVSLHSSHCSHYASNDKGQPTVSAVSPACRALLSFSS